MVNVANATITSDAGSTFNIYGGDFDSKNYNAGSSSAATINVDSSSATIDVAGTSTFGANSTVMFDFNNGVLVSTWYTSDFTIGSGAKLEVLGLGSLGINEYELVNFSGNLTGSYADPADITITGLGAGLVGTVEYDADSMNLVVSAIPEPSSAALLGLGGLALILRRSK